MAIQSFVDREPIVVAVVRDGSLQWYVSEKELWFLDYTKWGEAFKRAGCESGPEGAPDRFNIEVVDESTAASFLAAMDRFRATTHELRQMLRDQMREDDSADLDMFGPALLVDFDRRIVVSMYQEPSSFEDFVPDGWEGAYRNFLSEIPERERYWIVDGRDVLQ